MPPMITNQALVPLAAAYSLSRLMAGQPVSSELLETAVDRIPMVTRDGFFKEVLSATPYPEDVRPNANLMWKSDSVAADIVRLLQQSRSSAADVAARPKPEFHPFDYSVPNKDPNPEINAVLKTLAEERISGGGVRPSTLCSLASAYLKARRYDEALAYFQRAIRIRPHPRTFAGIAALYRQVDQLDDALLAIDEAIRRNRGAFAREHFERGLILRRMDRYEDALAAFTRAIRLEGGRFAKTYLERAVTHRRLSRWEEALKDADAAIRLNADRPQAHCERARVLRLMRRLAEAMDSIKTALALNPLCPFSQREWERIESERAR